jgi:hypothetical protein
MDAKPHARGGTDRAAREDGGQLSSIEFRHQWMLADVRSA